LYLFHIIENKLFLQEISVWYKTVFVKWIFMLSCQLLTFITCILFHVYKLPQSIHWIHWWTVCDLWYHHYPWEVLSVQRFSTWKCGVFESENNIIIGLILLLMYAKELLVVNNPSLNSLVNSLWSLVWRMTRSRGRPFENGRMYCFSKTICTYRWGIKNVLSIVRQIYS